MKNDKDSEVVELVVYTIKPNLQNNYINDSIEKFRKLVMSYDGFISYQFYQGCRNDNKFMDFVRWKSLDHAEAAARQVKIAQTAPEYAEYLEAFESLDIFCHFSPLKMWE